MDKAQALRLDACLPQSWWEFAVLHAVHLYNRTPIRRLKWKTPFEMVNKSIPDVSHLRVFGTAAYVFLPEDVRANKLAPKSELIIFKVFTLLPLICAESEDSLSSPWSLSRLSLDSNQTFFGRRYSQIQLS